MGCVNSTLTHEDAGGKGAKHDAAQADAPKATGATLPAPLFSGPVPQGSQTEPEKSGNLDAPPSTSNQPSWLPTEEQDATTSPAPAGNSSGRQWPLLPEDSVPASGLASPAEDARAAARELKVEVEAPESASGATLSPATGPESGSLKTLSSGFQPGMMSADDGDWDWVCTGLGGVIHPGDPSVGPQRMASLVEHAARSAMRAPPSVVLKETTGLRVDKVHGCMFVNQYLVTKFLGRGACGKVFLCLNTDDLRLYAMKAVRKVDLGISSMPAGSSSNENMEDILREIAIMKTMRHPNIVTLHEIIDDPVGNKLLLVMEYMDGGPCLTREELEKRERLPEHLARRTVRDMIKALDHLHAHMIVHGDLKPENVLLTTSGSVKLSDFGCSKVFASNEYLDRCNGTPAFLAPEMMKPNSKYRGRPTDVYALGVCLYTLVFGRIPFSATSVFKLFQVVQREPVTFPAEVPISDSLKGLLMRMLTKNPRERITLAEMARHPWVTLDGRFPLKCFRELKPGETNEEHDLLPEPGLTFAKANPEPSILYNTAQLSNLEHTYKKGDIIMKQGDKGMYLLHIVEGTVDILLRKIKPSSKSNAAGPSVDASSADQHSAGSTNSHTSNTKESRAMVSVHDSEYRLKLIRAANSATDFVTRLDLAAAPNGRSSGDVELLVAQRGPGNLIGEMALFSKTGHRTATVRCATPVTARVILLDGLEKHLEQNPAAKVQIKETIMKRQAEINVVDALVKLAIAREDIAAPQDPRGCKSGSLLPIRGGPGLKAPGTPWAANRRFSSTEPL